MSSGCRKKPRLNGIGDESFTSTDFFEAEEQQCSADRHLKETRGSLEKSKTALEKAVKKMRLTKQAAFDIKNECSVFVDDNVGENENETDATPT